MTFDQFIIDTFRQPDRVARLVGLLVLPCIGRINGYSINRRQWSGERPLDH